MQKVLSNLLFYFIQKLNSTFLGFFTLLVLLLLIALDTKAQNTIEQDDTFENTEIVIEKNKKIVFPELPRKFEKAPNTLRKNAIEPKEYNFKEIKPLVSDLETKIKISTIKEEINTSKKRNYVRAGIGNYITTYAEGQLLAKPNRNYQLGLYAKHFGSILGPVANSSIANNTIESKGKYFFKKSIASLSAQYNHQAVNYYGYDHNIIKNPTSEFKDSIRQNYHLINIQGHFLHTDTNSKYSYEVAANYNHFFNRYKNVENELEIAAKGHYEIDNSSKIVVNTNISIGNYADSTANLSRNLINIRPEYHRIVLDSKLQLMGGFNLAFENDTISSSKNVHFYPIFNADYQLLKKLNVYAGLDGGMEKNLYRTFVSQNPFIGTRANLTHTNKQFEFYLGLKGNIISTIQFNTNLSYTSFKNLSLFTNSTRDISQFDITYDNATLTKFKTEIAFQPTQTFQLSLKGAYFRYNTMNNKMAWHRPAVDISAQASYNIYNKIWFSTEVFYLGGIKAYDFKKDSEISLNDIVDINITTNYKLNDRFSFFLYFYNILSQNYQRYYLYKTKGITAMGGLTYTF